jgi:phosphoribosylformylglycinamidine (FGAM) synthase-like enzyme
MLVAGKDLFSRLMEPGKPPGKPASAPAVYRALYTAIFEGLVCSAHDLSEGGLAIAAAEMALAGRCGASIDVSPFHQDSLRALFGETNGCLLVEVRPKDAQAFEDHFQSIPIGDRLACIALEQSNSSNFRISQNGKTWWN